MPDFNNNQTAMFGSQQGMQVAGATGQIAGMVGSMADALHPPNRFGNQGMATNILKNVGSYTAMGAQFGPVGAGIGAAVGLTTGIISGIKQNKQEKSLRWQEQENQRREQMSQYAALAAGDPSQIWGNKNGSYFANGGDLRTQYMRTKMKGGSLSALSSNSVEVKGRSHEQGGVKIGPNEVEGGETIAGDYVFSKRLGFADIHKPLAKAIGMLEKKPVTAPNINSLGRLRKQEQILALLQEDFKRKHNLD